MKRIFEYDDDGKESHELLDLGFRDLNEKPVEIGNADGFGGCDVIVGNYTLTWNELDRLKAGIAEAERLWRR